MIDQRKLPAEEVYVRCKTAAEVARAIKTMVIRGAPAIGVAAAMGIALGMRKSKATGTQKFAAEFHKICDLMAATRPTAVNLFWAIERMKRTFAAAALAGESVDQIKDRLDREADAIHDEDVASCRAMGAFGAEVVPDEARILTHCNAGALATAGYGTALGVIRGAVEQGKHVVGLRRRDAAVPAGRAAHRVGAGARRHPDHGHHRQHGRRADAARARSISSSSAPIALPPTATPPTRSAPTASRCSRASTTFRSTSRRRSRRSICNTPDGAHIPIEERNAREVTHVGGVAARARRARWSGIRRSTSRRIASSPASSPSAASSGRRTRESLKRAFEERASARSHEVTKHEDTKRN